MASDVIDKVPTRSQAGVGPKGVAISVTRKAAAEAAVDQMRKDRNRQVANALRAASRKTGLFRT